MKLKSLANMCVCDKTETLFKDAYITLCVNNNHLSTADNLNPGIKTWLSQKNKSCKLP